MTFLRARPTAALTMAVVAAAAWFVSGVRGRRPAREIDTREPALTIPHVIPMLTFQVLKWERCYFNVFWVPKNI